MDCAMQVTSLHRLLAVYFLYMGLALCQAQTCTNSTDQTCVSCVSQPLDLVCGPGEIVIGHVMAGFRNRSRKELTCGYLAGDCLGEPVPLLLDIVSCLWSRQSCSFTLKGPQLARDHKCAVQYKPVYLVASDVKCVPEERLHRVCRTRHQVMCIKPQTSGFILSPDFPKPYGQQLGRNGGCTITIATSQGLGIHLQSTYMDVQKHKPECEDDYIQITWDESDVSREVRHCGRDSLDVRMTSQLVVVTFVFVPAGQVNQGFVLNYTAFPIPPSTEQSTLSSKAAVTTTKQATTTSHPVTLTSNSSLDWSSVYLILCMLLFTLLLLSITTFGLILYCTRTPHTAAARQARGKQQYNVVPDPDNSDTEGCPSVGPYSV